MAEVSSRGGNVSAPGKWKLKDHVSILLVSEKSVLFSWLGQRIDLRIPDRLSTQVVPRLIARLRELASLDELEEVVRGEWKRDAVEKFISALCKRGLAYRAADNETRPTSAHWSPYFQLYTESLENWSAGLERLNRLKLVVHTKFSLSSGFLASFASVDASAEQSDTIHLLLLSANDGEELEAYASRGNVGDTILPVLFDLHGAIVGPLSGGAGRPCLRCISARLRTTKTRIDLDAVPAPFEEVEHAWPQTYWKKIDAVLTEELFKLRTRVTYSSLERGAYVFDFLNHRSDYEDVFPVPGCVCSRRSAPNDDT